MKKKFQIFIFIVLLFQTTISLAQDTIVGLPLITNYKYLEYHAHYQNFDAIQTKDGIMLFANGNGVLSFDGVNWKTIKLPNNATCRALAKDSYGNIYVGGQNTFGKLTVDSLGQLKFTSLLYLIPKNYRTFYSIWNIIIIHSRIYVFTSKFIFDIDLKHKKSKVIVLKHRYYSVFKDSKNRIFLVTYRSFSQFENDTIEPYSFDGIVLGFYEHNDSTFFADFNGNIYNLDANGVIEYYKHLDYQPKGSLMDIYSNKKYIIITSSTNGIYLYTSKGKFVMQLNKKLGLTSDDIYFIYTDNYENLWVGSNWGLSYVELNSPIRIFDSRLGFGTETYTFSRFFNSRLYLNTAYKLYSMNLNLKHFNIHTLSPRSGQLWSSVIIDGKMYISRNPGILVLDKNENIKTYGPEVNVWKILKVPDTSNVYLLGTINGIYVYHYNGDSLKYVKKIKNFDNNAREMVFDRYHNLWIGGNTAGVYRLKLDTNFNITKKEFYGKSKGLWNTSSIMFFKWKNKLFFSTYKTLFQYDFQKDSIYEFHPITDRYDHSGNKIIQLVGIDNFDNLWFEYYDENYDFNVLVLKQINGKYVEIMPYSRRLQNFSVAGVKTLSPDMDMVLTMKGIVLFNVKDAIDRKRQKFDAFITHISLLNNDSSFFYGYTNVKDKFFYGGNRHKTIQLTHQQRNLKFDCAANFYIEPKKTKYRYILVNYDKDWSKWTYESKKEYTNLPSGHYIFKVQAKNIYGQISKKDSIKIYIKYPWYFSPLAYIVYFILGVLLIIGIVKYYTYNLQKKNEKLEEVIKERTSEILQKNVELEQQKEEILTQSEELILVNQELQKLSAIARETDNAVILADKEGNFIWVNNAFTRIFGYTFDELVNEVSRNLISEKTDPEIKALINKCLTEKVTVEYELKVRNKFDKEIWVHTTLTPILGEDDEVESLVAIDSDITSIKIAEKQITEQRDQITSSIRYARTIQESILPKSEFINKFFEHFIIFSPKDIVSGDLYWISKVFEHKEDNLIIPSASVENFSVGQSIFFAVVDCTGHGVPGAFMSLIANNILRFAINEERVFSPREIIKRMDSELSNILSRSQTKNFDGMTLSLCRIDKTNKDKYKITFAGAKEYISYYKFEEKKLRKLKGSVRQIGFVINDKIDFDEKEFELKKGDYLFMYTDGLKDLNNSMRKSFGYSRIRKIIEDNIEKGLYEIEKSLLSEMKKWLGNEKQRDDITFIGLKMK